jgi:hypothetical protein
MLPQPAFGDGVVQRGTVLLGRAAFLKQERPVDLLDVDAAVLQRLGRVGDLQQLVSGDGGSANGLGVTYFMGSISITDMSAMGQASCGLWLSKTVPQGHRINDGFCDGNFSPRSHISYFCALMAILIEVGVGSRCREDPPRCLDVGARPVEGRSGAAGEFRQDGCPDEF